MVPTHESEQAILDNDLRTDDKRGLALYVLFSGGILALNHAFLNSAPCT